MARKMAKGMARVKSGYPPRNHHVSTALRAESFLFTITHHASLTAVTLISRSVSRGLGSFIKYDWVW